MELMATVSSAERLLGQPGLSGGAGEGGRCRGCLNQYMLLPGTFKKMP